jgi:hypothetical protein
MTILNNGNVGIGYTNPAFKLDVNGTFRSTDVSANRVRVTTTTPTMSNELTSKSYVDTEDAKKQATLTASSDISASRIRVATTTPSMSNELTSKFYVDGLMATKQSTINNGDLSISQTSGLQTALDAKQATLTASSDLSANRIRVATTTPTATNELTSKSYVDVEVAKKQAPLSASSDLSANRIRVATTTPTATNELTSKSYVDGLMATKQSTINNGDLSISQTSGLQSALDAKQATLSASSDLSANRIRVATTTPTATNELTSKSYVDTEVAKKQAPLTSSSDISASRIRVTQLSPSAPNELTSKSYVDELVSSNQATLSSSSDISVNALAISMDICDNYALSISGDLYLNGTLYDKFGDPFTGSSSGIFLTDDNLNFYTPKNVNIGTTDICSSFVLNVDGGVRITANSLFGEYYVPTNEWIEDLCNNFYTTGKVGIGTSILDSSDTYLYVNGGVRIFNNQLFGEYYVPTNDWIQDLHDNIHFTNGKVGIGTIELENVDSLLYVNGKITADSLELLSDKRLKYNIEDISGSLDILRQLKPKKYNKYSTKPEIGFIANDVIDIHDISYMVSKDGDYYSLNYNSLFSLSIQCIKDLDSELNNEKLKNAELLKRLLWLEEKMDLILNP